MIESLRLYKREKLCSLTAINTLFTRGESSMTVVYPIKAVWRRNESRNGSTQFLISVPKKKIRNAVDRVKIRRRIREAYRLNRSHLVLHDGSAPLDIAFIYLSDSSSSYPAIEKAVIKVLQKISERMDFTAQE